MLRFDELAFATKVEGENGQDLNLKDCSQHCI